MRLSLRLLAPLLIFVLPMFVTAQDDDISWTVAYFDSKDFDGDVVVSEVVSEIDFNFSGSGYPPPEAVGETEFSLRAEANIAFEGGTYRFRLGSDDGARLIISEQTALDRFVERSYTEDTVDVFIPESRRIVRVEYFQDEADGRLTLTWERISEENLNPANDVSQPNDPGGDPADNAPAAPAGQVTVGSVSAVVEGLSVRSGPFLGASRLDIIAPGTEYPVFARNTAEGEFTWYYIQVQDFIEVSDDTTGEVISQPAGDPTLGWVSGRYFIPQADNSAIPAVATVFESLGNPQPTGVTGVLRSNMRLREGASYRTPTLEILDWGAEVEIVGRTIQANQNHWFQVIYEDQVGWLFAPFITINGDINIVPTY